MPSIKNVDSFKQLIRIELQNSLKRVADLKDFHMKAVPAAVLKDVDLTFQSTWGQQRVWGYAQIIQQQAMKKYLDPAIDVLALSETNPRGYNPVFVRTLLEKGIPCAKDGPLNVAKGHERLDRNWAKLRERYGQGPMALIRILEWVNSAKHEEIGELIDYVHFKFLQSKRETEISLSPLTQPTFAKVARLCDVLIEINLGGTLPQWIVTEILAAINRNTNVGIVGGRDSVNVANIPSRKPGDVCEIGPNGRFIKAYEVSAAPVTLDRVIQAFHDDIVPFGLHELVFLCKGVRSDAEDYANKRKGQVDIYFIDLHEWVRIMLDRLGPQGRSDFLVSLKRRIDSPLIPASTKETWNKLTE